VGQRDIKTEEDLPISDVHFPTTETVDGSADVLGADISRPDVGHTSNGVQQTSMESTSPTHEAHWSRPSFLDASHHRTRSVKDWPVVTCTVIARIYKKKKFVEKCQSDKSEAVIYISYLDFGMNIADLQVDTLWVHVGGNKFLLGKDESKVDWEISRRFRCIKTEPENTCEQLKPLGNHFMKVNDKTNPTVWLCCHWGPESDMQPTGLQPTGW